MSKIIKIDSNGNLIYEGILSSKEKATIDDILATLKKEIPEIEKRLALKFGKSAMYKYHLGLFLGDLLDKYDIQFAERRKFCDEIKYLASEENRKRNEGKKAATRSFYHQCYELSKIDKKAVEKLSWRQWQDLLDRVENRNDIRLFEWIKTYPSKISETEWRSFEKALHSYLKNKDTSVFDDDELFGIYSSIMNMCKEWHRLLKEYSKKNPESTKLKKKTKWENKYYSSCYLLKKELGLYFVTEEICVKTFTDLML